MASFEWFVSDDSGTLANEDSIDAHLRALTHELDAWEKGDRNAQTISQMWRDRLHAEHVAMEVTKFLPKNRDLML
jgi:hypothetical protein